MPCKPAVVARFIVQPTRVCPEQYVRVKMKDEERAAGERKGWGAEVQGRQGKGETWGQGVNQIRNGNVA